MQIANRQLLLLLLILQILILHIVIILNLISLKIIILIITLPLHALVHLLPLPTLLLLNPASISVMDVGRQVIETLNAPIGSRGTPGGNRLGW